MYCQKIRSEKETLIILQTLISYFSGIFKPGMNAILGPTGSGKSS